MIYCFSLPRIAEPQLPINLLIGVMASAIIALPQNTMLIKSDLYLGGDIWYDIICNPVSKITIFPLKFPTEMFSSYSNRYFD